MSVLFIRALRYAELAALELGRRGGQLIHNHPWHVQHVMNDERPERAEPAAISRLYDIVSRQISLNVAPEHLMLFPLEIV